MKEYIMYPMGLFELDYVNIPGRCVYTEKGGLKFRADEEALLRYFDPILHHVSLNDLIGEAAFWILLPTTAAIWILPILLYTHGILFALIVTALVYLILDTLLMVTYIRPLNYVIFILGNPIPQILVYIFFGILLYLSNSMSKVYILAASFLFFRLGMDVLIFSFINVVWLIAYRTNFSLPKSDQILRNIGWYYAKKFGIDPFELE